MQLRNQLAPYLQETDNSSILSQIKTQDEFKITDDRLDAAYERNQRIQRSRNIHIHRQPLQHGLWTTDTEEAFLPTQQTLLSSQMLSALLPAEPLLALTQPPQQAVLPVVPVVEAKDENLKKTN